jgi:hypothetical protein
MKTLKDSSEIQEAVKLFDELVAQSAVGFSGALRRAPAAPRTAAGRPTPAPRRRSSSPAPGPELPRPSEGHYRGDRLENTLYAMCKRGGFQGAVIADGNGLPLAVYNSPVGDDAIAAFTIVLGDALEKAGRLLDQSDANNISLDINLTDKAVLRRFAISDLPYFMMMICPQDVDERAEAELSIDQIIAILKTT